MSQRIVAIAVALVAIVLTIFAFSKQQGAANNEATAVANAQSAAAAQSQAESAQQTAIFQMDARATAQTEAEITRSAANLIAQQAASTALAAMSQAAQQEVLAATAVSEATEQAEAAAQAQSQATQQAATAAQAQSQQAATATAAAVEANHLVATGDALQAELTAQADILASQQNLATSSAATADALASASAATAAAQSTGSALDLATTIAENSTTEAQLAATAQIAQTEAAQIAVSATYAQQIAQATLNGQATAIAAPADPKDTMQFLIQQGIVPENNGAVVARLGKTTIDLSGQANISTWNYVPGTYTDFVISADATWGSGDLNDSCDIMLRIVDDNNHFVIGINRQGEAFFDAFQKGQWEGTTPYVTAPAVRVGASDSNHMVVAAIGSLFTIYVNDQLVATYHHTGFASGWLGIGAGTDTGKQGAGCTFQNTWVWAVPAQPAATPTLTATPAPTIQATLTTATTPFPVPRLNQRKTTQDGKLTFNYPAGWQAVDANGGTSLYSTGLSPTTNLNAIPSGEMEMVITWLDTQGSTLFDTDSMLKILTDTITKSFTNPSDITFAQPDTLPLTGHEVSRSIGTSAAFDVDIWVYADQGSLISIVAVCAPGEVQLCEPTLSAIVKTFKYNPAG